MRLTRCESVSVRAYVAALSPETQSDIAGGRWDEVMTDRLYAVVGAQTPDEMAAARALAEEVAAYRPVAAEK